MKQLFTLALIVISLITNAQNTATPSQVGGKDIYVLLVNSMPYDHIETVQLTKDQIANSSNFESKIATILSSAKSNDFDAITTRDGVTVQLIKYKNVANKVDAKMPNYFGKEVYFFSTPTKKYKVIATKEIPTADLQKSFYQVASIYYKNENVTYDAVIISENNAQYIQYK